MIEHLNHDDEFVLFAGNLGRFVPGQRDTTLWRAPSSSMLRVVQRRCLCSTECPPISTSQSSPKQPLWQQPPCQVVLDRRPSAARLLITGDSVFCAAGPQITFDRKVFNDDGTPSERFVINEEFISTLDYVVFASLWASITEARDQAQYYLHRVKYYKLHDGKQGRRYWREDLYECLLDWQSRFPQLVRSRKSTVTETVVAAGADAGEVEECPAGW